MQRGKLGCTGQSKLEVYQLGFQSNQSVAVLRICRAPLGKIIDQHAWPGSLLERTFAGSQQRLPCVCGAVVRATRMLVRRWRCSLCKWDFAGKVVAGSKSETECTAPIDARKVEFCPPQST